jgi:hypothetical protein
MSRYAPDVRARLYHFELESPLFFIRDTNDKSILLKQTTPPDNTGANAKYDELAPMLRPKYDGYAGGPGDDLNTEIKKVMKWNALRSDRLAEILIQVSPPYMFFAAVLNLQAGRHRRTFELMSIVQSFGAVVIHQFKHAFRVVRPADRSSLIQPIINTPGHGSYPAGHALQCHLQKHVLDTMIGWTGAGERYGQLDRLAKRIAENRIVAGLHYETDNVEGAKLAKPVADYFCKKAAVADSALKWLFDLAKEETKDLK